MSECLRNGIKVYPVCVNHKWKIRSEFKGRKKTFDKVLSGKNEINEAMKKTYEFYYNKYLL